ncbi:PIN domain-like protein [Xylariaceae sp. FL1019]|nr:PIN domain-like protein [Xylariaceae sp. FL1019]
MGLNNFSLAEEGEGEIRSLAKWAAAHYKRTSKPLRIAVDEGNWWFRNVTEEEDARIKIQSPGSHMKERNIMDRLFTLLRLNIQVIFVLDGPNKPKKLDRKTPGAVKKTDYSNERVKILTDLLRYLGVPYHKAPGEAEAECARLQQLVLVDAVWTDDSDAMMFGATTIVQFYKAPGKKSNSDSEVLTYTVDRLKLSRNDLLMWAILVGCDYTDGLDRFAKQSFKAIHRHHAFTGVADQLKKVADASDEEFNRQSSKWRAMLTQLVRTVSGMQNFQVPDRTFPSKQLLKACAHPTVSPDHEIMKWSSNMQARYTLFFRNFYSRKHEIWVAQALVPIELNALLRAVEKDTDKQLVKEIVQSMVIKERKGVTTTITVNPLAVIPELESQFPQNLMRGTGERIMAPAFSPMDVEILDCVLQYGLPGDVYHEMVDSARKKNETKHERKTKTLLKGGNQDSIPKRGRGRPRKDAGQNDNPRQAARRGLQTTEMSWSSENAADHGGKWPRRRDWAAGKLCPEVARIKHRNKGSTRSGTEGQNNGCKSFGQSTSPIQDPGAPSRLG